MKAYKDEQNRYNLELEGTEAQIICIALADFGNNVSNELQKKMSKEDRSNMVELLRETTDLVTAMDKLLASES